MNIVIYVLNLLRKKRSTQKNIVKTDDELEKEIETLTQTIDNVLKKTELTYMEIDKVKKIINELKIKRQTNYKYPICLKNGEIDLSEIDD